MGRRLKKKGKKGNIYGRGLSLYVEQSLEESFQRGIFNLCVSVNRESVNNIFPVAHWITRVSLHHFKGPNVVVFPDLQH